MKLYNFSDMRHALPASDSPVHRPASADNSLQGRKVVVILGPTGAGKSSLIKGLSGDERITVGDGLNSETPEITSWTMTDRGIDYALVDTPGFDDSYRSNREIVEQILQWLATEYRNNIVLAAVIYVHSIMDPRMQGVARQNLRMFQKLVGTDSMRNVILATSFWDQVDPSKGQEREMALTSSSEFFGSMIEKGATYLRLGGRAQNLRLLDQIASFGTVTLQCQKEMVDEGMSARNTAAAQITTADMAEIEAERRKHQEEVKAIQERAARQAAEQKKARDREKRRIEAELARQKQLAEQRRLREQQMYDAQIERQRQEREAEASRLRQVQQQQIEQQRLHDQQVYEIQQRQRQAREAEESRQRQARQAEERRLRQTQQQYAPYCFAYGDGYGNNNCVRCTSCAGCQNCTDCVSCVGCQGCVNCRNCVGCQNCSGITGGYGLQGIRA